MRRPQPPPLPTLGVYLLGRPPGVLGWESRWVRWPDFRLPADPGALRAVLTEAWERSATGRVEVACGGGTGRTGTALACLAVLDGVPAGEAVAFVRRAYRPRAGATRPPAPCGARAVLRGRPGGGGVALRPRRLPAARGGDPPPGALRRRLRALTCRRPAGA